MRISLPAALLCVFQLPCAPARAAGASDAFISTCATQLLSRKIEEEKAQNYCRCAEKQRYGVLDGRAQRAMDDAMSGKQNAFRAEYSELTNEQFAEQLKKLDALLASLAKKTDEVCGVPVK